MAWMRKGRANRSNSKKKQGSTRGIIKTARATTGQDRERKKKSYMGTMWNWSCTCVGTPFRVRDEEQCNGQHQTKEMLQVQDRAQRLNGIYLV